MTLDDAIDRIVRARKRLNDTQQRVGRRNGRAALLKALREARQVVDQEYPPIPKKRPGTRRRRRSRLSADAHSRGKRTVSTAQMGRLLNAGVAKSRFRIDGNTWIWTDAWIRRALDARVSARTIAEACRSPRRRKRLDAALRLGAGKHQGGR